MSATTLCAFLLAVIVAFAAASPLLTQPQDENPSVLFSQAWTVPFNCTTDADCDFNGRCMPSGTCRCDERYVTYGETTVGCNYKKMNRLLPFLMEFFFGFLFGVGYFILGKTALGVGQLLAFFLPLFSMCASGVCVFKEKSLGAVLCNVISTLVLLGAVGWWIYALVAIGTGDVTDDNGVPTYW